MGTGPERLSDKYRELAEYMRHIEFSRGFGNPRGRLDSLDQALDDNGITGPVEVPIRSGDGEMEDASEIMDEYQRLMRLRMEQFDVERAVRGLVARIARPLDTHNEVSVRGTSVKVEMPLAEDKEAMEELLRAVSAETGRKLRMTIRPEGQAARLHFDTQRYRASTRLERKLGPLGHAVATVIEFATGIKTIDPGAKATIDTCETPEGFMRDYYNEWLGFVMLLDSPAEGHNRMSVARTIFSEVVKLQHRTHGVLIRPFRQYFPSDAHEVAINDKNFSAIKALDELAQEANELYDQGKLKAGKFRELAEKAKKIALGEEGPETQVTYNW